MAIVIWSFSANEELDEVLEYFNNKFSKESAIILAKKIVSRIKDLEHFPKMGRIVPEIQDEKVRELIEGKYRIIYEMLDDDVVLIAKIHHSSRNLGETI
jgi:toxin ParE1/3/4